MSYQKNLSDHIAVIGAGHGGSAVVGMLRQFGFTGPITLIGDEPHLPYHRPLLSKTWLKGEVTTELLAIKQRKFYEEQNISLRLGHQVRSLDTTAHRIFFDNGEALDYDRLVLATGAQARKLLFKDIAFSNCLSLRNLADAERLRNALKRNRKIVIIGGGYVGLECTATARAMGAEVTLIEQAPRILERVASKPIATFLHDVHMSHGVRFIFNACVETIQGTHVAESVRLTDGKDIPCDLVIVAVGSKPITDLAEAAGLACDDGITVNYDCLTSHPDIFAIGDVVKRPHPFYGCPIRLESVHGCMEHAKHVASIICGREPADYEVPWFWSDQYDLKLQIVGLPRPNLETVLRGDPATNSFAIFHLHEQKVVMVESINAPQTFIAGKKLTASGKTVKKAALADATSDLKTITS